MGVYLAHEGEEKLKELVNPAGGRDVKFVRKSIKKLALDAEMDRLSRGRDVVMGRMLRCRVRYFTDGARKLRGNAAAAAGMLWSVRDLRKGICSGGEASGTPLYGVSAFKPS